MTGESEAGAATRPSTPSRPGCLKKGCAGCLTVVVVLVLYLAGLFVWATGSDAPADLRPLVGEGDTRVAHLRLLPGDPGSQALDEALAEGLAALDTSLSEAEGLDPLPQILGLLHLAGYGLEDVRLTELLAAGIPAVEGEDSASEAFCLATTPRRLPRGVVRFLSWMSPLRFEYLGYEVFVSEEMGYATALGGTILQCTSEQAIRTALFRYEKGLSPPGSEFERTYRRLIEEGELTVVMEPAAFNPNKAEGADLGSCGLVTISGDQHDATVGVVRLEATCRDPKAAEEIYSRLMTIAGFLVDDTPLSSKVRIEKSGAVADGRIDLTYTLYGLPGALREMLEEEAETLRTAGDPLPSGPSDPPLAPNVDAPDEEKEVSDGDGGQ